MAQHDAARADMQHPAVLHRLDIGQQAFFAAHDQLRLGAIAQGQVDRAGQLDRAHVVPDRAGLFVHHAAFEACRAAVRAQGAEGEADQHESQQ
ncbi:hypothetical protein [Massilia sp. Se16.2.3]|uniref:hypothetical protein n=1 Tax=Massilia sp. Se16.2.3 TaxID=2709303 RepID=UPI001E4E002D|nr:hypothetical protein [Massilia sp. Se16.2.3]